jgi:chromosome segregation ATPase
MADSSDECMFITELKPVSRKRKNLDRINSIELEPKSETKSEAKHEANDVTDKKYGTAQIEKLKKELAILDSKLTSLNSKSQKPNDERNKLKTECEKKLNIFVEYELSSRASCLNFEEKILPEFTEKESGYTLELAKTRSEVLKSENELENLEKTSYFTNEQLLSGEYKSLVENFPTIYSSYKTFVENSSPRDDLYSEILIKTWDDLFESDLLDRLKQEEKATRKSFPTSEQSEINEKAEKKARLEAELRNKNAKHENEKREVLAVEAEYRKVNNKTSDCQNSIENVEKNIEKLQSSLKSKAENIESVKKSNANKIVDKNDRNKRMIEEKISDICQLMSDLGVRTGKEEEYDVRSEVAGDDGTVKNDKVKEIMDLHQRLEGISKRYSTGYEPRLTLAKLREMENHQNATSRDLEDHRRRNQCEYYTESVPGKPNADEWRKTQAKYFTDKLIEMEKEVNDLQEQFKRQIVSNFNTGDIS